LGLLALNIEIVGEVDRAARPTKAEASINLGATSMPSWITTTEVPDESNQLKEAKEHLDRAVELTQMSGRFGTNAQSEFEHEVL